MVKKKAAVIKGAETTETSASKQGTAVVLPNGKRRIDFIRESYYGDAVVGGTHVAEGKGAHMSRSAIKNAINEMLKEAGRGAEEIAYQIVFAGTKKATWTPAKKTASKAEDKADDSKDTKGKDKK